MDKEKKMSQGTYNAQDNSNRPPEQGFDWRAERERRRDWRREHRFHEPLRGLFWGLLLILVGILFFINQQQETGWDDLWKYLVIGLGGIFIVDGLTRSFSNGYHFDGLGRFIPGIVLLFVGLAFLFNLSVWWPVVLIGVGVLILISILLRRRW
jgi:hypothetical protein